MIDKRAGTIAGVRVRDFRLLRDNLHAQEEVKQVLKHKTFNIEYYIQKPDAAKEEGEFVHLKITCLSIVSIFVSSAP